MTTTAGETTGEFSTDEIAYLARRGEVGIGLIMTPACYCHKSGHSFERQVGCHSDAMMGRLSECASAINSTGAASFLQIHHGGNAAKRQYTGRPPMAPSAVKNRRGTSELPQAMTEDEIWMIIDAFASAAQRAQDAGFTGIEIHGANTYLFQQFFSRFTNRREDEWGGSLENRCRFAVEVVKAVRAKVGHDFPISYRISPEEEQPDGYTAEDAVGLLNRLIPPGIDIVHVSSWEYGKGIYNSYPDGRHPTPVIADGINHAIPVIGVGSIFYPEDALRVLDDGIDLVAMGRALLLQADWAVKVRDGRRRDIRTGVRTLKELNSLDVPERMKGYLRRFFPVEQN